MDSVPAWPQILTCGEEWAGPRRPKDSDIPLILYRDANSWCPFCHRVWFFMELKGLRYATERIHLRGDRAEPPKQSFYKRMVPSGAVPAVRIRDEVVPESMDVLFRLEEEFPEPWPLPKGIGDLVQKLVQMSMAFNTDSCDWLHNTSHAEEESLRQEFEARLQWLEGAFSICGGPFFCGAAPSLVDAAYIGFLTRCAHCLLYFKQFDIRNPAAYPRICAWFVAMEPLPAYEFTKQDASFEQRIYQAHPERRPGAEACMMLGRTGSCVGEPDCSKSPEDPVAALAPGSSAALEAALRLAERRGLVARFLLRKHSVDATEEALVAAELHLQAVAGVLAGLTSPAEASRAVGGSALASGPVGKLGSLIGVPRDMSSAAAAQVRGALLAMNASGSSASKRHFEMVD